MRSKWLIADPAHQGKIESSPPDVWVLLGNGTDEFAGTASHVHQMSDPTKIVCT